MGSLQPFPSRFHYLNRYCPNKAEQLTARTKKNTLNLCIVPVPIYIYWILPVRNGNEMSLLNIAKYWIASGLHFVGQLFFMHKMHQLFLCTYSAQSIRTVHSAATLRVVFLTKSQNSSRSIRKQSFFSKRDVQNELNSKIRHNFYFYFFFSI